VAEPSEKVVHDERVAPIIRRQPREVLQEDGGVTEAWLWRTSGVVGGGEADVVQHDGRSEADIVRSTRRALPASRTCWLIIAREASQMKGQTRSQPTKSCALSTSSLMMLSTAVKSTPTCDV